MTVDDGSDVVAADIFEVFFRFDCTSSGWTARHQPQENVICTSQPAFRRARRILRRSESDFSLRACPEKLIGLP